MLDAFGGNIRGSFVTLFRHCSTEAPCTPNEEAEHSEEEPVKSRPPASEIFQSETAAKEQPPKEPVLEVEQCSEEEPAPEPAPQLSIQPIQKPKRQASAKQREH